MKAEDGGDMVDGVCVCCRRWGFELMGVEVWVSERGCIRSVRVLRGNIVMEMMRVAGSVMIERVHTFIFMFRVAIYRVAL